MADDDCVTFAPRNAYGFFECCVDRLRPWVVIEEHVSAQCRNTQLSGHGMRHRICRGARIEKKQIA